jgi:hypothetical protein
LERSGLPPLSWIVRHHYVFDDLMSLETFPTEILVPSKASIRRAGEFFSIQIELQPFTLDDEEVTTSFILEPVRLPQDSRAWTGRSFTFPRNPTDGYVDGSIYLRHAHNPADVTSIKFGEWLEDSITAEFSICLVFEFEGIGFRDTDVKISVPLQIRDA